MYKVTKLSVRKDAANKKSNKQLRNYNEDMAQTLMQLGVIEGGYFAVEEGQTFTGVLDTDHIRVGGSLVMQCVGGGNFYSSEIVDISEKGKKTLVKTQNSIYQVERVAAKKTKKKPFDDNF